MASTSGVGAATGTGRSFGAGVASTSGVGTATGTGRSTYQGLASSSGAATCNATAASIAGGSAQASGASLALAVSIAGGPSINPTIYTSAALQLGIYEVELLTGGYAAEAVSTVKQAVWSRGGGDAVSVGLTYEVEQDA